MFLAAALFTPLERAEASTRPEGSNRVKVKSGHFHFGAQCRIYSII